MLDQVCDIRLALHRQCLDLFSHALLGIARREWRALDAMQIGAQFATAPSQALDGVGDGLALGQLRRLGVGRFERAIAGQPVAQPCLDVRQRSGCGLPCR